MKKSPAFQLYVNDFLTGTMDMTAEQVGGYIRLLCHQFDKDGLPDDDRKLLKLSGVRAKNLKVILNKFVKKSDNKLHNLRLTSVISEQNAYRQKQIENGKKGGFSKNNSGVATFSPPPSPQPNCDPSSSPSSSPLNNSDNTRERILNEWFERAKIDQYLLEAFCKNSSCEITEYIIGITHFFTISKVAETWRDEKDFKKHLINWCRTYKQNKNGNAKKETDNYHPYKEDVR